MTATTTTTLQAARGGEPVVGRVVWVGRRPRRAIDFALDCAPDTRLRLSGLARPTPVIPAVGTKVAVSIGRSGYVDRIEPLGEAD